MSFLYYYHNNAAQLGPYYLDELRKEPLQADFLVWKEGAPNWVKAKEMAELKDLFVVVPPLPQKNEFFEQPPIKTVFASNAQNNPSPIVASPIQEKIYYVQAPVEVKSKSVIWGILKWLIFLVFIIVIGTFIIANLQRGNTSFSMAGADISATCTNPTNLLVASTISLTVNNHSSRTHRDVTVKIIAYDKRGNFIKEKTTTFDRTLEAHGGLTKPIGLPAGAASCACSIISSN